MLFHKAFSVTSQLIRKHNEGCLHAWWKIIAGLGSSPPMFACTLVKYSAQPAWKRAWIFWSNHRFWQELAIWFRFCRFICKRTAYTLTLSKFKWIRIPLSLMHLCLANKLYICAYIFQIRTVYHTCIIYIIYINRIKHMSWHDLDMCIWTSFTCITLHLF